MYFNNPAVDGCALLVWGNTKEIDSNGFGLHVPGPMFGEAYLDAALFFFFNSIWATSDAEITQCTFNK